MTMNGFFASMFAEMGARRRRMRSAFGDRGQALVEFLVLGGLALGSLGLLTREGMIARAAWGFALPPIFVIGFLAIEARRQAQSRQAQNGQAQNGQAQDQAGAEEVKTSARYDWLVLLWSFGCALLGVGAFMLAWTSQPHVAPQPEWQPPREAVDVDISP